MGRESIKAIRRFLLELKRRYNPEKVILFGSRAGRDYLKTSDYDLIIVSGKFEGMKFLDRISELLKYWDYARDVDMLPYTPGEFKRKMSEIGIVREAAKKGIDVRLSAIGGKIK